MYLISPDKQQYKANLHCHSIYSDGKKTPEELKEMYKEKGYSILSITDHEAPKNHSYLNDEDFLTITGYEVYIRDNENASYNAYAKEIHINLFAKDPENEAIVGYNQKYCKYVPVEEHGKYEKVGSQEPRKYCPEYINKFLREAKDNGYIAAYNHPWWSMEDEADVLSYDGFFSMEMCNYGAYQLSRLEYAGALYDKMLKKGKKIFCHSADDNHNGYPVTHPKNDSFGAFTMVMPEKLDYDSVIDAMESGEMYSSMGPVFKEVSIEGNKLHVECSDVERIIIFTGSKTPLSEFAEVGGTINTADFEIDPRAEYVRVSVVDKYGRFADTRGFFRDELGLEE